MKSLGQLCLAIICCVLIPGTAYALSADQSPNLSDSAAYEQKNAALADTDSKHSPIQRIRDYFSQIASKQINENIEADKDQLEPWRASWAMLDSNSHSSAYDTEMTEAVVLSLPMHMSSLHISPYFMQVRAENSLAEDPYLELPYEFPHGSHTYPKALAEPAALDSSWWLGAAYSLDLAQLLLMQGQLLFGSGKNQATDHEFESWQADLALAYPTASATPKIWGMYATGDENNPPAHDIAIPKPFHSLGFQTASQPFFQSRGLNNPSHYSLAQAVVDHETQSYSPPGLWQIGFGLSEISIMDNLKYSIGLAYGRGTYDQTGEYRKGLTKKDSYIEARLDQRYHFYENLAAILELGYASLDLDPEIWGEDLEENAYLMTFGLSYEF